MAPLSSALEPSTPISSNFSLAAFAVVADRLEAILDHETQSLRNNRPCDLIETCGKKRQGLLELSRFLPSLTGSDQHQDTAARLGRLETKIALNQEILSVQIGAVHEVAEIIARTLREADSDGTYSLQAGRS